MRAHQRMQNTPRLWVLSSGCPGGEKKRVGEKRRGQDREGGGDEEKEGREDEKGGRRDGDDG